eukprot:gb/GFBE01029074.1/.p1 GENE.gb/GFBE01029074.1/~~gb/GFBE01029074.1/.p1  ORF type:complete len:1024 (+),score=231.20 gb/GFBE01029074.1/:1-3072(+)
MAAEAGVAAAGVAATGLGLFGYNRENYLYDAEFRFERFNAQREYAIAQTEQYREDLRTLTDLTSKKNNTYAVIATLDMALCIALYCAGRLGLHGPSPPGWLMGLWLTTNAASFGFMALAILLALHASYKAQAASVHLLTRKIRVPVPSVKQLDKARKFASEFEQQAFSDMFRVPYISNNGAPKTDETSAKVAGSAGRARSASPARRSRASKASSWIREEFETDKAGTVTGTVPAGGFLPADAAPEHFRLYAAVQKEWFQHDIYARVCMLLGFSAFVQSLAFYGLGHIIVELRAFWVSHATAFVIEVLHVLLLRFDIIQGRVKKNDKIPSFFIWLGPVAVVFATIGMSIDFRVEFSIPAIVFTWICIFGAYICQFCYQLRLLEIILPDDVKNPLKMEESPGDSWWPSSWRCPSAFAHVLYFVAPPSRLQPGQFDIAREVKEGPQGNPFEMAGVPGMEGKPVDPSAGASAGMSQEDITAQVQYLDRLFDYFLSDQVHDAISDSNKQRVKDLYAEYSAARRKGVGAEAMRTFTDCLVALEGVMAAEGMQQEGGYASDSGYSSAGSASSGSSGSSGDEAMKGYSWDGRRLYEEQAAPLHGKVRKMEPWFLVKTIQTVVCAAWLFMIVCMVIDIFIGDQGLLTAPHWSRPPMTRLSLEPHELGTPLGFPWYSGAKPFLPEQMAWHEEKRHASSEFISPPHSGKETGGGGHSKIHMDDAARRLSVFGDMTSASQGMNLHDTLQSIMEILPGSEPQAASAAKAAPVTWPGFFEPRMLACGPHGLAALSPRGVGAVVSPRGALQHVAEAAQKFRLGGLTHLPPLMAASWQEPSQELLVVSRAGHVSSCPGPLPAAGGIWACQAAQHRLPVPEGARLRAVAAAYLDRALHAAFIDEAAPDVVALYKLGKEAASWLPVGEIPVPRADEVKEPLSTKVSLAFTHDGQLVLTTAAGAVLRRRLQDGAIMASSVHPWGGASTSAQWQASCPVHHGPEGSLAHLRLRRSENSQAWHPELVTERQAQMELPGLPPLFQ